MGTTLFDDVVICAVPGGAKISIEAIVTLPLEPRPADEVPAERRRLALAQIEASMEALLPPLVIRCSER